MTDYANVWPHDIETRARQMYEDGVPPSKIAKEINCGKSKNAVIGKANRDGWDKSKQKKQVRPKSSYPVKPRPKQYNFARTNMERKQAIPQGPIVISTSETDLQIPVEQRKTLMQLTDSDCRWPVGTPNTADFFYCGAVAVVDKPYCGVHCRRAYTPSK